MSLRAAFVCVVPGDEPETVPFIQVSGHAGDESTLPLWDTSPHSVVPLGPEKVSVERRAPSEKRSECEWHFHNCSASQVTSL